jgi:polyhydroxyalkanoate synthesis repressor PhaR
MEPGVLIRKYENRRLYDTATSRYVNLDEIAALIRQGKDVKVIDAKTGKDLTRVTLTQIITEDAKDGPSGLPLELLRQLIVASDQVRQEFMMWYLKSALDAYQKMQDAVQSSLGGVHSALLSPVDMMKKFLTLGSEGPPPKASPSEVETLRRRIAQLESRRERPSGKAKRRK